MNRYLYAGADPVMWVDPGGHDPNYWYFYWSHTTMDMIDIHSRPLYMYSDPSFVDVGTLEHYQQRGPTTCWASALGTMLSWKNHGERYYRLQDALSGSALEEYLKAKRETEPVTSIDTVRNIYMEYNLMFVADLSDKEPFSWIKQMKTPYISPLNVSYVTYHDAKGPRVHHIVIQSIYMNKDKEYEITYEDPASGLKTEKWKTIANRVVNTRSAGADIWVRW